MKVFLTGGAGYIGSVTTELLLNDGHDVVVFDNLERGHKAAVDKRAKLVQGDLRDAAQIQRAMKNAKPDAVMHFAAYALVGESMNDPGMYFANNTTGATNLVEAMVRHEVPRIVFSSTCATYGFPDRIPITEDTPQRPVNPYGESKLMFEKVLAWYQKIHGIAPVFLRYFNACGATEKFGEDHEPETHLIPNVIRVAMKQQPHVNIFGTDYNTPDGTCIRDYIHIVDLGRAHILALTGKQTGPFNLGTGNGFSVREVIDVVRKVTKREISEVVSPRRPGDPDRLVASAEKAKKILKWVPKMSNLDDIVESAWAWHRAHPDGYKK
ncbi:MAG: UDP-glucose 4-epimerase GalE [bacterium]